MADSVLIKNVGVKPEQPEVCSVCRHDGPREVRYNHRVCMAVIKRDPSPNISTVHCGCLCDEERAKRPTIEVTITQ